MTADKLTPQQLKNLTSKMWRMNNLYTIITKDKKKQILKLNYSQRQVLTQFKHHRKIILKSRQQGISTLYIAYYLDSCITKPNYSAGIQSYGKDEAEKLAMRAKLMWDEMPESFKSALGIELTKCNTQEMQFSNGSILKIGNFRGDTLQALHVSELGKIAIKFPEKARELKTGAFEAVGKGNKITIESTAEGKTGLFYDLWKRAQLKKVNNAELSPFDFEAIFLSWLQDPDCNIDTKVDIPVELAKYFADLELQLNIKLTNTQKWWYCAKYDTLGEDMKREYPSYPEEAFEQSVEGTYYKNEYAKLKIDSDLYDPNLVVHSAFDLGMNDDFSIGFFQVDLNNIVKIVGEYTNSGFGLEHYADVFRQLTIHRGWKHGITFVPHDIKQRELISGKTRWQALKELGFKPVLVKRHKVQDGIEATRQFLKTVIIDAECEIIRGAIQNYRKRYDSKLGVYLDAPLHDEFSHPADMLRYMAMGCKYQLPKDNMTVGSSNTARQYSSIKRSGRSGYDV